MLSYTERGQGPALLFVHAFPLDGTMWHAQLEYFADRYRVVVPDVIGFGASQPPVPWTMPRMGEELLRLMDHLGIGACTLVGLSMGGYIALPFALSFPHRVERLVLAHTRARADTDAEKAARDSMIEGLRHEGVATLPDKMMRRLLGSGASTKVRDWVRSRIEKISVEAAIHAVTALRNREDQTRNLSRLHCPTLVIAGSGDSILSVTDCEEMAAAIPGGGFGVITNTGHLSNLEDPNAFNDTLEVFLTRYDSE